MSRVRLTAVLAVTAAAIAGVVVVFASGAFGGGDASAGNGYPTSLATLERRDLSSQTQVDATLGYADPAVIVVPSGTAPTAVAQAEQAAATAQVQLDGARSTAAADSRALANARATLAADRAKLAADCAGDPAGQACTADAQATAADEQAVGQAEGKVQGDPQAVASAQTSSAGAAAALAAARRSATQYGQSSTYTRLPAVGATIRRGQALYDVDGEPVLLLYGTVAPWRAFGSGMSPGRDVAELNANLQLDGNVFTAATTAAIEALQHAAGATVTGTLPLGSVAFQPGAVRVTAVTPTLGGTVQPGPVLNVTSTRRVVQIALDAASQATVKVGDPVTITMPDQSTTPGRVTYVGTVATAPSSDQGGGNGNSSPTIEVDVVPTHPAATGHLDQAPVLVAITTAGVRNALVARVDALLALASGGYALEVVGPDGTHRLEAVETGIFDDSDGLVQVTGPAVRAGQRVVVPGE